MVAEPVGFSDQHPHEGDVPAFAGKVLRRELRAALNASPKLAAEGSAAG